MIKNRIALLSSYYNMLKRYFVAYFKKPVEIWPYSQCSCNLNELEIGSLANSIKDMAKSLYLSPELNGKLIWKAFNLAR